MTIDPTAAVAGATEHASGQTAAVDPVASPHAATNPAAAPEPAAAHQAEKIDFVDYMSRQETKAPDMGTLTPEGQAKHLSNPAALGEKVLEGLGALHERSSTFQQAFIEGGSAQPSADPGAGPVSKGPAAEPVAGSGDFQSTIDHKSMIDFFNHMNEATLAGNASSSFMRSFNTLMKGQ